MLRLADLEQSKNAVLHSLGAASSQESYGHAIDEFIGWYCSEPRLSFNRTVVYDFDIWVMQRTAEVLATLNSHEQARRFYEPVLRRGPAARYWTQDYLEAWITLIAPV